MPLFGWSHYSLEGAHISCSIEWKSKDKDTVSYNVTALILFFFIPCIILLASNIKLFLIVGPACPFKTSYSLHLIKVQRFK
jgi:c-opsin